MAKFTINHNEDYSVIANTIFRDDRLSWKAKGLLANMLSLPDNWDYSLAGLVTLATDGLAGTRTGLKELEKFGYLERKAIREKGKIIDWEYLIYETPSHDKPLCDFLQVENLQVEKPQVEKPQVENQTQLNTNQLSTKELSTNKSSTNINSLEKSKRFVPPTIEEVQEYCNYRHNDIDAEYFVAYYTARDWVLSNGKKVKDWKSCIITWEKNNSKYSSKPTIQQPKQEDDFFAKLKRVSKEMMI